MSAAQKKAPSANGAIDKSTQHYDRIPRAGFVAIRHLLDAARQLHQLPALPFDAIQGARILLARIDADIARLDGAK